jgi:prepilin-type N-terminal cleavage/methylation domain-containing protein
LVNAGGEVEVQRKAFTLIELLAVVALIGVMVTVGIVSFSSSRGSTRVFAAVRDVMAMVRRARSVALVTQKPALLIYSNVKSGDETMIKVEIKAEKLFSSSGSNKAIYTLSGEQVSSPESASEEEGGETLEDVLSPDSLSQDVAQSLRVKVITEDEELVVAASEPRARSRISIYSTADNVSRTYDPEAEKKKDAAAEETSVADENDAPVKVVFSANGTVEPAHKIWIYPDGKTPDKGYCIEVDRFGEPKCAEIE